MLDFNKYGLLLVVLIKIQKHTILMIVLLIFDIEKIFELHNSSIFQSSHLNLKEKFRSLIN